MYYYCENPKENDPTARGKEMAKGIMAAADRLKAAIDMMDRSPQVKAWAARGKLLTVLPFGVAPEVSRTPLDIATTVGSGHAAFGCDRIVRDLFPHQLNLRVVDQ